MEITIQYTGQLAGITGAGEEAIEVDDGTSVASLVNLLCSRHGEKYADLLVNGSGELRPSTLVILDGVQSEGDRAAQTLDGVKTVMLMTPIAGG